MIRDQGPEGISSELWGRGWRVVRLGVMGGSFDPIHIGHLIMAESVRETLALDSVLFVPVSRQPLKKGKPVTSASHRAAMLELAILGNPHFSLSRVDIERAAPSYTVDTLSLLREEWPGAKMWFIVGADSLATFPTWREPDGILAQSRLAVVRRPDVTLDLPQLEEQLPGLQDRIDWVDAPLIGVSATDLRHRIAEGRSIRYQVPDMVREYIDREGLYREKG